MLKKNTWTDKPALSLTAASVIFAMRLLSSMLTLLNTYDKT